MVVGTVTTGGYARVIQQKKALPPLSGKDIAQAIVYLSLVAWALAFLIVPPAAFLTTLDYWTRIVWLSLSGLAALAAAISAFIRLDLKGELPALYVCLVGPGLYFLSQAYLSLFPPPSVDPSQRFALVFFAIYGTLSLIPRIVELRAVKRRTKMARDTAHATSQLTAAQSAQPGAFPELEVKDAPVNTVLGD